MYGNIDIKFTIK